MGFCSITCAECKGTGKKLIPYDFPFSRAAHIVTCTNCNGVGSVLMHTGQLTSYQISVDPAGSDASWAVMWEKLDDGTLAIHDMALVEHKPADAEPSEQLKQKITARIAEVQDWCHGNDEHSAHNAEGQIEGLEWVLKQIE